MRALRPVVHVRLAVLSSERIGHFVADTAILLARRSLERPDRTADYFWLSRTTCNEQWSRMVRRQLPVRSWVRYVARFNDLIPGGAPHVLPLPSWSGDRAVYEPIRLSTERFRFWDEEDAAAKAWLARRGWKEGEHFVCLQVRDSAYLLKDPLHAHRASDRYAYHNYRDSDIGAYVQAARTLVDAGYWVIRMGKVVHEPLPLAHPRVIDYPFATDKNDLLDIWLSVNSRLFVSTATGIDTLAWVYGRPPVVYVNALPLFALASPINNIWVPKHLRWRTTGEFLTLREHCWHSYSFGAQYEEAGILVEDLSPAEITAAIMEGAGRVAGTWTDTEEDLRRQRRFWELLRESPTFSTYHGYVHPEARVGSTWLRSMGDKFLT